MANITKNSFIFNKPASYTVSLFYISPKCSGWDITSPTDTDKIMVIKANLDESTADLKESFLAVDGQQILGASGNNEAPAQLYFWAEGTFRIQKSDGSFASFSHVRFANGKYGAQLWDDWWFASKNLEIMKTGINTLQADDGSYWSVTGGNNQLNFFSNNNETKEHFQSLQSQVKSYQDYFALINDKDDKKID